MSTMLKLRVMTVGPTGVGKSSTANTILMAAEGQEKKIYREGDGSESVTRWNEEHTRTVLGRELTILDAPGADNIKDEPIRILKEIRAGIEKSDQDYDALLYCVDVFKDKLQLDDCTLKVFRMADQILGPAFWEHVILVFTHKDNFYRLQRQAAGADYQVFPFTEFISRDKRSTNVYAIGPHISVVKDAAVLIENTRDRKDSDTNTTVEDILKTIEEVRERNEGQGYNRTMLKVDPVYPQPVVIPPWEKAMEAVRPFLEQYWVHILIGLICLLIGLFFRVSININHS